MTYCAEDPWLLPFLSLIRHRPGMFLGDESVRTLEVFIRGYIQARRDLELPAFAAEEDGLLTSFEAWLSESLGDRKCVSWATFIEQLDPSGRNVISFMRYFEDFLKERGMSLAAPPASSWSAQGWRL